jgi:hypothetical protein
MRKIYFLLISYAIEYVKASEESERIKYMYFIGILKICQYFASFLQLHSN